MRFLDNLTKWIFILCLPFFLFSASFTWVLNSPWIYRYGFRKYDVSQTTGLPMSELDKAVKGLINYYNSDEEYIHVTVIKDGQPFELFNQREILHMKDVKGLIWLVYWVLIGTAVYVLAYAGIHLFYKKGKYRHRLTWRVIGGSGLTLLFMLIILVVALTSFDQLFLQFHLLGFSNDLWQLDPTTDYLLMMVGDLQFDMAIFAFLAAGGGAVVLGGATGSAYFFNKMRAMMKEEETSKASPD